jgi:hypothetical protein
MRREDMTSTHASQGAHLDLIIRWKASAMRTLGLGCFDAEAVRPSTQAGRVYRLCQRVERLRDELSRVEDSRVKAILAEDAELSEDDETTTSTELLLLGIRQFL